jgi:hypothetical protein
MWRHGPNLGSCTIDKNKSNTKHEAKKKNVTEDSIFGGCFVTRIDTKPRRTSSIAICDTENRTTRSVQSSNRENKLERQIFIIYYFIIWILRF